MKTALGNMEYVALDWPRNCFTVMGMMKLMGGATNHSHCPQGH